MTEPALEPTAATLARRWFGHGPALRPADADGIGVDVTFTESETGRRLAWVEGGDSLGQDLAVAILTATGSDPFNVRFGFDGLRVLTQDVPPALLPELLRLSVLQTVSGDARVREVLDVRMEPLNPGERRWRVDVELRTVLGDVLRLSLGEVDAHG
jgi:hypothetical protein